MNSLFPNVEWSGMWGATGQTLYMTAVAVLATFILGLLLGLALFLTGKGNLWENRFLNFVFSAIVNIFRSIPFIILIILLLPFTLLLVGSMLGANAALPALIIGAAPFYARMVEIALREIDKGVIEAAKSMGSSNAQIIFKVLIPESLPALVSGITVTSIALVGYTAMAGVVGAGGLGNLAFLEGFQRTQNDVTFVATVIILIIVFIIQFIGDNVTRRLDKR
ncbi:ABC transporter permease [Fictibacillus sp. WQ 8-8]|uniref:ABC transporter permease n=1 Tax=Fictibacillus marinisediminis TaxID=2878389 RepID=A0A9X2BDY3_9BACL|nr:MULTISPECIES: methionine ABC transporter permease [Fictibacillus]SFD49633.1 D-methionine transport system permease protein [Bacillus sp. OV194]MCK6258369.1 ABC transporter permease [Fictibacillus marinisediminis]MCQ6264093.1 ABC transporter permease [Fictibacillus sp. WQ 8-8]MED2971167.1 ABC transporter permease [Fictibacillus sp. B-59209]UZJ79994.1 ABC transporter permease [Fictibacillus sp. KU28468]